MKSNSEKLSLSNMLGGAVVERFDYELERVLKNIQDPNTEAIAVRSILIRVKIKPDNDRNMAAIGFDVVSKPAPLAPLITRAVTGIDIKGNGEAFEMLPHKQMELPDNILKMKKEAQND